MSASGPMWCGALESGGAASVRDAIDMLVAMPGTRILVLGEMSGRIETDEKDGMAELAAYAKHQGVDKLFAVGEQAELAARHFGAGARHFSDEGLLMAALNEALTADCALVVQGAHFICSEVGVQTTAAGVADVVGTQPKQV